MFGSDLEDLAGPDGPRLNHPQNRLPVGLSLIMRCVPQPYYVDEDDFWKACDQNQMLVIDKYLSTGGDMNACDTVSDPKSPLTVCTSLPTNTLLYLHVQFNRTGLHRASTHGHTEVVTKLLEAGADIHSKDKVLNHRGGEQGHSPVIEPRIGPPSEPAPVRVRD